MKRGSWFILGGLLTALLLAGVASNFASAAPDGLNAASTKGCTVNAAGEPTGGTCMARNAREHELRDSPLAGYGIRGIENPYLATGLSGIVGVLVTFAVGGGIFWLARSRRPRAAQAQPARSATDQRRTDQRRTDTGRIDTGRIDTGRTDTGRIDTGRIDRMAG